MATLCLTRSKFSSSSSEGSQFVLVFFIIIILLLLVCVAWPRFPKIKVKMADLKRKLAAGTPEAMIKGVFDLLLSRKAQSRVSALGKGEYEPLDAEVFGALHGG